MLENIVWDSLVMEPDQTKEMEELIKKEKLLHKEIRADLRKLVKKLTMILKKLFI